MLCIFLKEILVVISLSKNMCTWFSSSREFLGFISTYHYVKEKSLKFPNTPSNMGHNSGAQHFYHVVMRSYYCFLIVCSICAVYSLGYILLVHKTTKHENMKLKHWQSYKIFTSFPIYVGQSMHTCNSLSLYMYMISPCLPL